jgi:hypothetical protein
MKQNKTKYLYIYMDTTSILFILGAVTTLGIYLSTSVGSGTQSQYGGKSSSRKHRRGKSSNNKTRHR